MEEKAIDLVEVVREEDEEIIDLTEEVKGETTEETMKRFPMTGSVPTWVMPLMGVALVVYGVVSPLLWGIFIGSIVFSIGLARCLFKTKRNRLIFGSLFTVITLFPWIYYLGG